MSVSLYSFKKKKTTLICGSICGKKKTCQKQTSREKELILVSCPATKMLILQVRRTVLFIFVSFLFSFINIFIAFYCDEKEYIQIIAINIPHLGQHEPLFILSSLFPSNGEDASQYKQKTLKTRKYSTCVRFLRACGPFHPYVFTRSLLSG